MSLDVATFGTGCFWCTEAVFQQVRGVHNVAPGYSGGHVEHPDYKLVCTGSTGHAECLRIEFDPLLVSYRDLLDIFFRTHDPTTLNRQGGDVGTQYRSVIFYHDAAQQELAESYLKELEAAGVFSQPIVTEISAAATFYPAEQYHHDYYRQHPDQQYCAAVIAPKLKKFQEKFRDRLA